jgi:hypothetical protein
MGQRNPFSFRAVPFFHKSQLPPLVISRRLLKTHPIRHEASIFVVTPAEKQKKRKQKAKEQKPEV